MTRPLLELTREVVRSRPGAGLEVEAYAATARTLTVKVFGRAVESISTADPRGLGVRVVGRGRQGYSYTSDLSATGLARVVDEAVRNASLAEPDPFVGLADPPAAYSAIEGLWQPGLGRLQTAEKVKLALECEAAARAVPGVEAVEEAVYHDAEVRVAVASTRGVEVETEQTTYYTYVLAHARDGADVESGHAFHAGRDPSGLDAQEVGRRAGVKATSLLGASPCPSAVMTVVLDAEIVAGLLSTVVEALSAEAVQKGRSIFATRAGETVGSALVTLVDDGLHPEGLDSSTFDGEGMPRQRTPLIAGGVLQALLHNSYTARKAGRGAASTGNAGRASYRGLPTVAATNLILEPGTGTVDELVRRTHDGLYVQGVSGIHSGINPVSGEISVGITGRIIEEGALSRPVREVTMATDFLSLLANVVDLSGERDWIPLYGSAHVPAGAVAGMSVSGR